MDALELQSAAAVAELGSRTKAVSTVARSAIPVIFAFKSCCPSFDGFPHPSGGPKVGILIPLKKLVLGGNTSACCSEQDAASRRGARWLGVRMMLVTMVRTSGPRWERAPAASWR